MTKDTSEDNNKTVCIIHFILFYFIFIFIFIFILPHESLPFPWLAWPNKGLINIQINCDSINHCIHE
jgi:hypothetical protein